MPIPTRTTSVPHPRSWVRLILVSVITSALSLGATGEALANDDWTQVGDSIEGLSIFGQAGYSTDMSADGSIVAVGAPYASSGAGAVRVYRWTGSAWEQMGTTLTGNSGDRFGWDVALSASGGALAVGAPQGSSDPGYSRAYTWDGSDWVDRGSAINGVNDDRLGYSVAISGDGATVVLGAPQADPDGDVNKGAVNVYRWTGSWGTPVTTFKGTAAGDLAGDSVAMSSDGNIVAFGALFADAPGPISNAGEVQVHALNGNTWVQRGASLYGEAGAQAGFAIALSNDGSVLAVGANNDASGRGSVSVFSWDGMNWNLRGAKLTGSLPDAYFGYSVALSSSGDAMVVGASGANANAGQTQMFEWNGTDWTQRGSTIDGAAATDRAGFSVAISADGNTVASGYPEVDSGVGRNAGQVRVFSWPSPPGVVPGPVTFFTFHLPDGRECTSISPMRVQVGTVVELPGVDANCRTMPGSVVAGWTIPVPPGFTGAGSSSLPFNPGHRVRVIESQRFTVVPFDPVVQIDYDANIAADDSCTPANVAHGSDDGRVAYVWVPREDFAMARTPAQAPCVPNGYRLTGWNTAGDGSGETFAPGAPMPEHWADDTTNTRHLYAMWVAS